MKRPTLRDWPACLVACLWLGVSACQPALPVATPLRVATYNIEDIRTADVLRNDHPRLQAAAEVIQVLRPDVLLINEMTYDGADDPWVTGSTAPGQNGQRFADQYLAVAQQPMLEPIYYTAYMVPSNTGLPSGFDLNNDGEVVTSFPTPEAAGEDGAPPPQTPEQRAYGNDAWGFGTFPGQYAMTILVRTGLDVDVEASRTFQTFRWSQMPDALRPVDPEAEEPWYDDAEWAEMRLSSKTHWHLPVVGTAGDTLHVLASHPTPPAFDGPEQRNKLRNHDEIRLWADYLSGASYIADDQGQPGGLPDGAHFVIMGDQNADPDEGSSHNDAIQQLLQHPRVNSGFVPIADSSGQAAYPDLDPDDTATWGLRVDYVLPSASLEIVGGGMLRPETTVVSDHFPVWLDVQFPQEAP
ncbi:MAG: endonuclease/exonuclease/phosphatase family protein [Bacteroidota bacterium]